MVRGAPEGPEASKLALEVDFPGSTGRLSGQLVDKTGFRSEYIYLNGLTRINHRNPNWVNWSTIYLPPRGSTGRRCLFSRQIQGLAPKYLPETPGRPPVPGTVIGMKMPRPCTAVGEASPIPTPRPGMTTPQTTEVPSIPVGYHMSKQRHSHTYPPRSDRRSPSENMFVA